MKRNVVVRMMALCCAVFLISLNGYAVNLGEIVYLQNENIRLGFDGEKGMLVSFDDLKLNESLLDVKSVDKSLWQVIFRDDSGSPFIDVSTAADFSIEKAGNSALTLRWKNFRDSNCPDLDVTVSVRLEKALSFWKIDIEGIQGEFVEKVIFPRISGLKDLGEEYLAVANWTGDLLKNPRSHLPNLRSKGYVWAYPGHTSMQLVTLYNPDKVGFYASCNDSLSYKKNFSVNMDQENNLIYHIENYPSVDLTVDSYSPPYEAVIGSYKGDWFTATEIYREWALQQKWVKNSRLKNGLIPDWVEKTALWVWNRDESSGVLNPAVELKKKLGLPVSVLWHWWHGCSYDDGFPEYLPPREGKERFINQMNYAKSEGVNAIVYMNQIQWGNSTESWKKENAIRYAIKDVKGKEHNHVFNIFSGKALTLMCVGTDFWKEKYTSLAGSAINDYNVSGIYMDQTCLSYFCYDPTHFHPTGGGNYWVENSGKISTRIRAQSKGKELPALSGEGSSESWLPHLDLFLTLQVSKERYAGVGGWETIPMFQVVYHPYALSFGNYSSLLNPPYDNLWPKEFVPKDTMQLLDKKFNEQFLMEQARSFVWGQQPMISNYRTFLDTERKAEMEYLMKLAKVRMNGLKYLLYGECLRMPKIAVPEKEIDISKLSIYAGRGEGSRVTEQRGTYPLIYSSAWKAEDGSIGLAFASIDKKKFPIKLHLSADDYGLPASGKIYVIDQDGKKELGTYKQGNINIQTSLPAKGICIIEIEPANI